jgi:hypothetical protein
MPTLQVYSNAASDVFPGGQVEFQVQFESYANSGQACGASGVTIQITQSGAPDSGQGTPVPTTGTGITELGMGLFTYTWSPPQDTVPGSYLVTWTGTRASDSTVVTYSQACNVAPDPESVPLPGLYASVAQFRAWAGSEHAYTPAQIIQTKLQRATEDIDVALVGAVYRVDADGMPLDPQLANVLVRATSAQAAYLLAQNDDTGIKREYSSTSVGGVTAVRSQRMQGGALQPLGPRALGILRTAGILPAAPLISWLQNVTRLRNGAERHNPQRATTTRPLAE